MPHHLGAWKQRTRNKRVFPASGGGKVLVPGPQRTSREQRRLRVLNGRKQSCGERQRGARKGISSACAGKRRERPLVILVSLRSVRIRRGRKRPEEVAGRCSRYFFTVIFVTLIRLKTR